MTCFSAGSLERWQDAALFLLGQVFLQLFLRNSQTMTPSGNVFRSAVANKLVDRKLSLTERCQETTEIFIKLIFMFSTQVGETSRPLGGSFE